MNKNSFIEWLNMRDNKAGNHVVIIDGKIYKSKNAKDDVLYYCEFSDVEWKIFEQGSNERYPEKKELIFEFQTEEDAFSKFADIIESAEWFFNERKRIDWEN